MCDNFISKYNSEFSKWANTYHGIPCLDTEMLQHLYIVVDNFFYFPVVVDKRVRVSRLKDHLAVQGYSEMLIPIIEDLFHSSDMYDVEEAFDCTCMYVQSTIRCDFDMCEVISKQMLSAYSSHYTFESLNMNPDMLISVHNMEDDDESSQSEHSTDCSCGNCTSSSSGCSCCTDYSRTSCSCDSCHGDDSSDYCDDEV